MKIEFPLDQQIIDRCNTEMETNRHKGNSWKEPQLTTEDFLLIKLSEEYSEFFLAILNNTSMIEKEGADLINIISMIMRRYRGT